VSRRDIWVKSQAEQYCQNIVVKQVVTTATRRASCSFTTRVSAERVWPALEDHAHDVDGQALANGLHRRACQAEFDGGFEIG